MFKSSVLLIALASFATQSVTICATDILIQGDCVPNFNASGVPTIHVDTVFTPKKKIEFLASKLSSALCSMQTAAVLSTAALVACGTVGAILILDLLMGNHSKTTMHIIETNIIVDLLYAAPLMVIRKAVKNSQEEIKAVLKNDVVESELQF